MKYGNHWNSTRRIFTQIDVRIIKSSFVKLLVIGSEIKDPRSGRPFNADDLQRWREQLKNSYYT